MACDLCKKPKLELEQLIDSVRTKTVKMICTSCMKECNKMNSFYRDKVRIRLLKRWINRKEKKAIGSVKSYIMQNSWIGKVIAAQADEDGKRRISFEVPDNVVAKTGVFYSLVEVPNEVENERK